MADHSKDSGAGARPERGGAIGDEGMPRPGSRERHRDDDDVRDPIPDDQRLGTSPDTRSEARGDARDDVGDTARGTAAERTGPDAGDPRDGGAGLPRYAQGSE